MKKKRKNVEYGGYEEINGVYVEKSHRITEDGRKRCPETGTDYSAQQTVRKGRMDLYEEETCDIIVVDVIKPWSRTRFDSWCNKKPAMFIQQVGFFYIFINICLNIFQQVICLYLVQQDTLPYVDYPFR